jgi:hypothetical protein
MFPASVCEMSNIRHEDVCQSQGAASPCDVSRKTSRPIVFKGDPQVVEPLISIFRKECFAEYCGYRRIR